MTYLELKEGLKKLDRKYLGLLVIIGGGEDYCHFTGFDLIQNGKFKSRPLTGFDLIKIIESQDLAVQNQIIPMSAYDVEIEENFWGDLSEITIGPLRARCAFIEEIDRIYPLEDYCDKMSSDEIQEIVHNECSDSIILFPETRLVITVSDGSMITDESECIVLKK